jgi:hypothetical protein
MMYVFNILLVLKENKNLMFNQKSIVYWTTSYADYIVDCWKIGKMWQPNSAVKYGGQIWRPNMAAKYDSQIRQSIVGHKSPSR